MLERYRKLVFDHVYYGLNDYHAAQEIASQVMALYCLKCGYQDDNKIRGWLIKTAKNYLKKHYENKSRERKTFIQYSDQLDYFSPEELNEDDQKSLQDAFHEAFITLSPKELDTILLYLRCRKSIKKMQEITGGSYDALKKQVSRIRKKLKAETYKNLGYYGSKRIVTPELDNLIYQFLRRFKKNLEAGTLTKMHYYFSEVDLKNYKSDLKISKICDYEILIKNSQYWVYVFYRNDTGQLCSLYIKFIIDLQKHLKIIQPPTKVENYKVIHINSLEGKTLKQLLAIYPIQKSGCTSIPDEEIEKLLRQYEANQKDDSR